MTMTNFNEFNYSNDELIDAVKSVFNLDVIHSSKDDEHCQWFTQEDFDSDDYSTGVDSFDELFNDDELMQLVQYLDNNG